MDRAMPARPLPPAATARLLAWYDAHARIMPWRTGPAARRRGQRPDPYHVWLSEVMLQQTQVATVRAYFLDFVARWPRVEDLAAAPDDAVMAAWAGLGYYSRARNLKKCAEAVAFLNGGRFPENAEGLRELPGIGAYTSAAIAAIAFDEPVAVVDGNVERVVSRLLALDMPPRLAKREIGEVVAGMVPAERPGDFAQAMMDLGATICTPRRPSCMLCPLSPDCAAHAAGTPAGFPLRETKAARPLRAGAAFVVVNADGAILLRKRPEKGLLGGMAEVPTTGWTASRDGATGADAAPFAAAWRPAGSVRHVFTHFELDLEIWRADTGIAAPAGCWWEAQSGHAALPSVMKKAIEAAIPGATKRRKPTGTA